MSRSKVAFALPLLLLAMTPSAYARRPPVAVIIDANVPPYTERWVNAGTNAQVRSKLRKIARDILDEQFLFLEWVSANDAPATIRIRLVENDASHRSPGDRPWILAIQLSTPDTTLPEERYDAASLIRIRSIPANVAASAAEVETIFREALGRVVVNGQSVFVRKTLGNIHLANDIRSEKPFLRTDILIPLDDLGATDHSRLYANLRDRPAFHLLLTPLEPTPDNWTECAFESIAREFQSPKDYAPYINKRPRQATPEIGMEVYDPRRGSPTVGDQQRKRKGP